MALCDFAFKGLSSVKMLLDLWFCSSALFTIELLQTGSVIFSNDIVVSVNVCFTRPSGGYVISSNC